MRMIRAAIVLAAMAGAGYAADPEPLSWRVVSVHDGDTLTCLDAGNTQHKVRLQGIDAPEVGQPFGTKARDAMAAMTMRKTVKVHPTGQDRYGRTLASVEADGRDVGRELIEAGLAWHYVRYSKAEELAAAERDAKAARRGLWADPEPVPPWEWRATDRDRKAAKREPAGR